MDMKKVSRALANALPMLCNDYPADKSKIIATGLSGGGMASHGLCMYYPRLIYAVAINTGMIHEDFIEGKEYPYPHNKIAVFLASSTDFRYDEMQRDQRFLKQLGWMTKWIEFEGGHVFAPEWAYHEAAEWLTKQFR